MTRASHIFAQGAVVFAVAILLAGLMSLPLRQAIQAHDSKIFTERLAR